MSLGERFAGFVCDLDGVVYRGSVAVEHAIGSLASLPGIQYATNNASRPPALVAAHLRALGLPCADTDVANSSQAGAHVLDERGLAGAAVLAVGGEGVPLALGEAGFVPLRPGDAGMPRAVLQGYGPAVCAADLAEAAYAIEGGALWVATNTDATLPTDRGVAPGNGSLVHAVSMAVGHGPHAVAGKPHAPLYDLCVRRLGLPRGEVLAIGDRLDTDIEGAHAAGLPSLLVLTGVSTLREVLMAPAERRPTWVASDLRALDLDEKGLEGVMEPARAFWARRDAARAQDAPDVGTPDEVDTVVRMLQDRLGQ